MVGPRQMGLNYNKGGFDDTLGRTPEGMTCPAFEQSASEDCIEV